MGYRFTSKLAENIYRQLPKTLDAAGFSELFELMNPRTAFKDNLANYEITKEWRDFTAWQDNLSNAQRLKEFQPLKTAVSSLEVQLSDYYFTLEQHGWKYDSSFSGKLLIINERVKTLSEQIKTIKEGKSAEVAGRLARLENVGWKYSQGAAGIIEAAVAKPEPGQEGPRTPNEMLVKIRKADNAEAPFLSAGLRGDRLRGEALREGHAAGGHRTPPTPSQVPPRDPAVVLREEERKAEEGKPGEGTPGEGKPEERKPEERKTEVRKPRPLPEIPKGPLK
jgi:hypothetical protein